MLPSNARDLRDESREAYAEMQCIRADVETVRAELRITHSPKRHSALLEEYKRLEVEWDWAILRYMDAQSKFTALIHALTRSR